MFHNNPPGEHEWGAVVPLWRAQHVLTPAVFISRRLPRTPLAGPVCFSLVGIDPWDTRMAWGLEEGWRCESKGKEGRRERRWETNTFPTTSRPISVCCIKCTGLQRCLPGRGRATGWYQLFFFVPICNGDRNPPMLSLSQGIEDKCCVL